MYERESHLDRLLCTRDWPSLRCLLIQTLYLHSIFYFNCLINFSLAVTTQVKTSPTEDVHRIIITSRQMKHRQTETEYWQYFWLYFLLVALSTDSKEYTLNTWQWCFGRMITRVTCLLYTLRTVSVMTACPSSI